MAQVDFSSTDNEEEYGYPVDAWNATKASAFIVICIEAGSDDIACLLINKLASTADGRTPSTHTPMNTFSHLRSYFKWKKISMPYQPCIVHLLSTICNLAFDTNIRLAPEFLGTASAFDIFFTRYDYMQLLYLGGIDLPLLLSLSSRPPDALYMLHALIVLEPHFPRILQTRALANGLVSVLKRYASGITLDRIAEQAHHCTAFAFLRRSPRSSTLSCMNYCMNSPHHLRICSTMSRPARKSLH